MRWNRSLVLLVASVGDTRVPWTFSSSTCSKRINGAVNVQQQRFQQEMFRHGNHDLTAVTAVAVDYRKSTLQKLMEHLASVTLSLPRCSRNLCQVTQVVCQMAMEMVCICGKKNSDLPLLCPPDVSQGCKGDLQAYFSQMDQHTKGIMPPCEPFLLEHLQLLCEPHLCRQSLRCRAFDNILSINGCSLASSRHGQRLK